MMNLSRPMLLALALLLSAAAMGRAENWPQWRGPAFNGSSSETGLPASWSKADNVAWATPLPGPSSATPVIWNERVFVSSVDAKSKDLVAICIDRKDGKILWQKPVGKDRPPFVGNNNMASPSPVTDGQRVWFYYGTGDLAAFDYEGKLIWSRALETDLGAFIIKYGYSSSPLLYKGKLYVALLQNATPGKYRPSDRQGPLDSYLLAIDPETGKDMWRHVRPTEAVDESREAYVTPVPFEAGGRAAVVVVGGDFLTGHDPALGKELWRWGYNPRKPNLCRIIPSAVPGDGLVYFAEPRARPLRAIRPDGEGTLGEASLAWTFNGRTTDATTPLYYKGRLYVLEGDEKSLTCLDGKTGEQKWKGPLGEGAVFRASPTGADGKVYCMNEGGAVIVLEAGDEFKVLSRMVMGEGPSRSSIAVAGGSLFIRTAQNLYCISAGAKAAPAAAQ